MNRAEIIAKRKTLEAELADAETMVDIVRAKFKGLQKQCPHENVHRWHSIDQSSNMKCQDCGHYEG